MASVYLTTRFGHTSASPSKKDMKNALNELFKEAIPSTTEADLEEHPNAWLEYSFENGSKWTVYTLDVYRSGTVIFSKLDDQDDDDPVFEHSLNNINKKQVLRLWGQLANGDLNKVTSQFGE